MLPTWWRQIACDKPWRTPVKAAVMKRWAQRLTSRSFVILGSGRVDSVQTVIRLIVGIPLWKPSPSSLHAYSVRSTNFNQLTGATPSVNCLDLVPTVELLMNSELFEELLLTLQNAHGFTRIYRWRPYLRVQLNVFCWQICRLSAALKLSRFLGLYRNACINGKCLSWSHEFTSMLISRSLLDLKGKE